MGVNMVGVNTIWHCGAPTSIEEYMQETGRAGQTGELAKLFVFWKPVDAPLLQDLSVPATAELGECF